MSGTATEDGGASELYRRIYQLVDLEYDLLLIACLAHLIPRACLSLIADRSDDGMLEEGDDGMTSFGRAMSIFRVRQLPCHSRLLHHCSNILLLDYSLYIALVV
jgi:hypothetical protein